MGLTPLEVGRVIFAELDRGSVRADRLHPSFHDDRHLLLRMLVHRRGMPRRLDEILDRDLRLVTEARALPVRLGLVGFGSFEMDDFHDLEAYRFDTSNE